MAVSLVAGFLTFFVVFFRLSLFLPYLYLALIPACCGILLFIKNQFNGKGFAIRNQPQMIAFTLLLVLTLICFLYDFFQSALNTQSSFALRMITLGIMSIAPAYLLAGLLKGDERKLQKIIIVSIWIQLLFFVVMYFSDGAKHTLYAFFGMGDSVNLIEQNEKVRGFGLSAEINYMTPFLMIFMCFFVVQNKYFLLLLTCLTQIVNSNMAVLAIMLALVFSKIKLSTKLLALFLLSVIVFSVGAILFPRFYDEFINSGGTRTIDILIERHVFTIGQIDWFSALFGFQQNISSSISDLALSSDMGWVIMFNYGGALFILLFVMLIFFLSLCAFGKTKLALIWFLVGVIFNTKGLALGPNGYMFVTFVYIFMHYYQRPSSTDENESRIVDDNKKTLNAI